MTSNSQSQVRVNLPAHWRQVSFICFDLAVLNVIGGIGAADFYSVPLQALGFARSSISLGVFFILVGLAAYKVPRLPAVVPVVIVVADILNTVLFLPKFELAGGVVLVKISFLAPVLLVFISMLRVGLKLRQPEEQRAAVTMKSGKEALALLSSMFVSVGTGLAALLLFAKYAMPLLTESTNPLINIFHDFLVVPALLLLFPLGAAAGELLWVRASRIYLNGDELELFIRYLKQLPLISRLVPALIATNHSSFDESSSGYEPSFVPRRPWRKYVLFASVLLISGSVGFVLVRGFVVPSVRGGAVTNETSPAPVGALVVSQTGGGHYTTITEALANAAPGSTIFVRNGVYDEAVAIDKDITLMGDSVAVPTIECAKDGCLRITAAKATIKNFTINAKVGFLHFLLRSRQRTAAVLITKGRSVMESCDITSNNGVGIVVSGSGAAPEIKNTRVHDCHLNGILFTNGSSGLVENSDGYKNSWAAIRSDNGSSPTIRRSRIHSGMNDGILVDEATATVEECEIFQNNYSGVTARQGSSVSLRQSKIFKNSDNGVYIHHRSQGDVDACEIFNNNAGIKVTEESGSRITNTRVHHHDAPAVTVSKNSTSEIDGATIYENGTGLWVASGGKPVVRKTVFRSHIYNAIDVRADGDPVIEQSQIYGGQGTGIVFREGSKGVINECAVFGNGNSNVVITAGGDPEIRKTRLSESRYAGVSVMDGGAGSLIECEVFNNYVGVEVKTNSTFVVQDSKITGNRHQGFVIDGTSEGSITGSTLTGNADGAWKIAAGARITREGNTE